MRVRLEHIVLNERVRLEHILVTEVKNCCGEQIFQFDIRIRDAGGILTVLSCDLLHRTQNHFRVLQEIIVQLHAVCIFAGFRPCGQLLRRRVTLLQEQNVGGDAGSGICLECRIGQTNCTEQVGTLGH